MIKDDSLRSVCEIKPKKYQKIKQIIKMRRNYKREKTRMGTSVYSITKKETAWEVKIRASRHLITMNRSHDGFRREQNRGNEWEEAHKPRRVSQCSTYRYLATSSQETQKTLAVWRLV